MAVTSGTFNLVKITKVEYGDADLTAGVAPTPLATMGTIKSGKLNLDFPEQGTTAEYSEQTQQPYRIRRSPVMNKASFELVTSLMSEVQKFLGGTLTETATPSTLEIGGSTTIANKYLVITGLNTAGKALTVTLHNAFITTSWSGAMGADQETVGLTVNANLLEDASADKLVATITAAF